MKIRRLSVLLLCTTLLWLASCTGRTDDGGSDTGGSDSVTAATDTQTETESEIKSETVPTIDIESETVPDTDGESVSESVSAAVTETERETESVTVVQTETETESETESETAENTTPRLEGAYAASIEHAERLHGEVNVAYNHNRTEVTLSNRNSILRYSLGGTVNGAVLTTPDGNPYLLSAPEVYIKNTDGKAFFLTGTGIGERMNIYRLGSYYYEVHMLDGSTGYEVLQSKDIQIKMFRTGHSIENVHYDEVGVHYTVSSTSDPYISGGTLSIDTAEYNALEITLTTPYASGGQVYIAAGSYDVFNGEQCVSFRTEPDGRPHTYIVPLDGVPDYEGTLKKLRLDVGAQVGEEICIHSIKAVKIASDAPPVQLDRTFHLYSDKINDVVRVVASENVTDLAAVGTITRIPADTVEKLIIKDQNGTHTSLDGVDFDSVEYVGLDIKGAGIYGMILLPDPTSGTLRVTSEEGAYVLTREYVREGNTALTSGESVRSGARIYTDLHHTFDAFLETAEIERHPLTEVRATTTDDDACYVGYDVYRGAYRFNVSGVNFSQAFANPDRRFLIGAAFEGADVDYPIYVYSWTIHGNLESGALLSKQNEMLPIALEVCKNFTGENEEPFYDKGDGSYGEIIFPMIIKAHETTEFTIVNLYQNWGNFPLKQLSSIQFIAPYYHLSTGSTETNCIAPYYVFGKDHWMLPDFRAMSAPLWSDQPQHASVGRLYFLRYKLPDGNTVGSESVNNIINSYGPTYSDIDMNYISGDGKMEAHYRHLEYPQWDENRTYYTIELTARDTLSFGDFKSDFTIFSFDGRDRFFKKLGYLNENNECVITDASTNSDVRYISLGNRAPYISYFDGDETDNLTSYVNFALIIKDVSITVGGESLEAPFIFRERKSGELNSMALSLDLGEITLQAGDKIVIHMILLPWGDPSAENDDNVRAVREDSCLRPYRATASVGTVVEDAYLPRILAENGHAEFTLSGGQEASAVRVYGFEHYNGIRIQEKVAGEWVDYDLHSEVCDYDGYTVFYDGDGTFSYAFIVKMDGTDRTFRVAAIS